ncbi:MAG: Antilisterial bacteriocin subtilosin biosynthesis protein AlbA [Candidatus Anoxychlamydiales bacterium]|nr:Antilisterial bacteriocin subtilosin biosynthesis protein AlbA [Candidatus Anoxychlamydiales bacterium]
MFFSIKENVYLVNGFKDACLYDLNKGDLFSINACAKNTIERLCEENNAIDSLKNSEKELVHELLSKGLIIPSNTKAKQHDILSLKQSYPITFAWIDVTTVCNLKCVFCYENASTSGRFMSMEDFKYAVDQLTDLGIKRIQITGGEPMLLNEKLKEMILYCHNKFSFLEVYSNGTLITKEWSRFFKENNVSVAISLHSCDSSRHDSITKISGSHDKTLKAIECLKDSEVDLRINGVITFINSEDQEQLKILHNVKKTDPVRLTGKGNISLYDFELFKKKVITKKSFQNKISKNLISKNLTGQRCFLEKLYVATNLDVYPCVMERRICYGNLREKKFDQLIQHSMRFLSKDNIQTCKDCEYRYACLDCRPDANGSDLDQKPWYCLYDPYIANWENIRLAYKKRNRS